MALNIQMHLTAANPTTLHETQPLAYTFDMSTDANKWMEDFYANLPKYALWGCGIVLILAASVEVALRSSWVQPYPWESVAHLFLEFVPVFLAAALVRPIEELVRRRREEQVKGHVDQLRFDLRRFDTRKIPASVMEVIAYDKLDWRKLLEKTKEVDLALLYCSHSWLKDNVPSFSDFVARGNGNVLRLYLPPWYEFTTGFYDAVRPNSHTLERLLRTVAWFRHACGEVAGLQIKVLPSGLGHVVVALKDHEGKSRFIFSPLPFGAENDDLPPAVTLSEQSLDEPLQSFVETVRRQFNNAAPYPDLEKSHYLTWDSDRNRVFVSVALSCSLNCDFCYIKSIISNGRVPSAENFGRILAYAVLGDPRFNAQTRVLIGGFTEPFLGSHGSGTGKQTTSNAESTVQFINTLTAERDSTYIHVATRSPDVSSYIDRLTHPEQVVINYSVSSYDGKGAETRASVLGRLLDAKKIISSKKTHVALYVRPVLPGHTLRDLQDFAAAARDSGMIHATVGGLYTDDKIEQRLRALGLSDLPQREESAKGFILAPGSKLRKMAETDEIEKVKSRLYDLGFTQVFDSSAELLNHVATNACRWQCNVAA